MMRNLDKEIFTSDLDPRHVQELTCKSAAPTPDLNRQVMKSGRGVEIKIYTLTPGVQARSGNPHFWISQGISEHRVDRSSGCLFGQECHQSFSSFFSSPPSSPSQSILAMKLKERLLMALLGFTLALSLILVLELGDFVPAGAPTAESIRQQGGNY